MSGKVHPSKLAQYALLVSLAFLVLLELTSLFDQLIFPTYQFPGGPRFLALSAGLFWAIAPLSVGLLLILIFISPFRFALDLGGRKSPFISRFRKWISSPLLPILKQFNQRFTERSTSPDRMWLLLGATVVSAVAIGLTPYRPDLNPQGMLVGIDSTKYSTVIAHMLGMSGMDAIHYSFLEPIMNGSRPLALLFLYALAIISGGGAEGGMRLAPPVLALLLGGASLAFVKYGLGDARTAVLASLLSICSYQVSVGIWAGYYANWIALAESYLFLTSVLLFAKIKSRTAFASMLATSLLVLFTHPWTWVILMALAGTTGLDSYLRKRGLIPWKPVFFLLIANVSVDLCRIFLLGSYGGQQAGYDVATRFASPVFIVQTWTNGVSVFTFYDGYLANSIYLGLALLAIIGLYRSNDYFSRMLVLWTSLIALPFVFLSPILESRLVYEAPIPVLTAIGCVKIVRGWAHLPDFLFTAFVVLFGFNTALQAVIRLVAFSG